MNDVPANLRPFVTPSIRKVYLDMVPAPDSSADAVLGSSGPASSSSSAMTAAVSATEQFSAAASSSVVDPNSSSAVELARLRAENHALKEHTAMWRKRAEQHGKANLCLLNFAQSIRDQAAVVARERNELQNQCLSLKRRLEEESNPNQLSDFFVLPCNLVLVLTVFVFSSTISNPRRIFVESTWAKSSATTRGSTSALSRPESTFASGSLLFAPAVPHLDTQISPLSFDTSTSTATTDATAHTKGDPPHSPCDDEDEFTSRPRKRSRHDLPGLGAKRSSIGGAEEMLSPLHISSKTPEEI